MELTYRRSTARSSSTSSVSMAMSFGSAPPLLPHLSVALLLAFSSSHHLHHHEFSVIWRRISLQTQKRFKKAMHYNAVYKICQATYNDKGICRIQSRCYTILTAQRSYYP